MSETPYFSFRKELTIQLQLSKDKVLIAISKTEETLTNKLRKTNRAN